MIRDMDLVRFKGGHIFVAVGSYRGEIARCRLAYLCTGERPDRIVDGREYRKVRLEHDVDVPGASCVLQRRGEQHFLLSVSDLDRVWRPEDAPARLSEARSKAFEEIARELDSLLASPVRHGLTGGGALGTEREGSDLDWVLYTGDERSARTAVETAALLRPDLSLAWDYVVAKYGDYGLDEEMLRYVYSRSWKFNYFDKLPVSFFLVHPDVSADSFLGLSGGRHDEVEGTIQSASCLSFTPRRLCLDDSEATTVVSFLNLHNSAFREGDRIAASGRRYGDYLDVTADGTICLLDASRGSVD